MVWRTPASCASSTTTAASPTTPPIPPSTAATSPPNCWRRPISGRSESRRRPVRQPCERAGYVPKVLCSCGALLHGESVALPYGIGDAAIGVALIQLPALLARLHAAPTT